MVGRPRKEVPVVKVFRAPRILTFEQLCDRLGLSRSTVFRRLREHGYYSSYNYSGRFLTIEEVADFDPRGLWFHKTARFSRQGTLKDTVEHLINLSERGSTHGELTSLLRVRVHNVLLELVEEKRVHRERLGPSFVYFTHKRSARREQILRRREFFQQLQKPRPTSQQIITTLLELIKDPRAERPDIVARCRRAGVSISRTEVDVIFEMFELDKKRAP
jgi:hypothetical protein